VAALPARSQAPTARTNAIPPEIVRDGGSGLSLVDWNNDGMDDLVWCDSPRAGAMAWRGCLATGDGAFGPAQTPAGEPWRSFPAGPGLVLIHALDLNGDGPAEWMIERRDAGSARLPLAITSGAGAPGSPYPTGRLVTGFADGIGRTLNVGYRAARDEAVYIPGPPVGYPIREIRPAKAVVSSIWHDTAGGDRLSQFSYHYAGNRLDLSGRGGLGFCAFTTFDHLTGFYKYQFLAQSFPMTGLTVREETYRAWPKGGKMSAKIVSSTDNAVLFDLVRNPFNQALYGTLHPFTARSAEYRWPNDDKAYWTLPGPGEPWQPGAKPLLPVAHAADVTGVTTTHRWYDEQKVSRSPRLVAPEVRVRTYLDDLAASREPTMDALQAAVAFAGEITHGNERSVNTDFGNKISQRDLASYLAPHDAEDPLTGLVEVSRRSKFYQSALISTEPVKTYTYFGRTPFWATQREEQRDVETKKITKVTATRYERDDQGRLTEKHVQVTDLDAKDATPGRDDVNYAASHFNERLDLPEAVFDIDDGNQRRHYNILAGEADEIIYEQGGTVQITYDGLGRVVHVRNPENGYRHTVEYAWTGSSAPDWRARQSVAPPPKVDGITGSSVYAVRVEKTAKPTETTYRDRMDRVIRVVTEDPKEGTTIVDAIYNTLGQTVAESAPYKPREPIKWKVKRYDSYGLVDKESEVRESARR
jgi:hypothetical protein